MAENRSPGISEVIAEVEAIGRLGLWPGFDVKAVPVMVFDSTDTWLFFSDMTPEGFDIFPGTPGVMTYKGQHPLVRGNSIVRLGEKWVATSVLASYGRRTGEKYSAVDLAGIIVHEQFHVFQRLNHPSWRQNDGVLLFYPRETNESVLLRKLEKEAFRRAVTSDTDSQMAGWAQTALEFRCRRLEMVPEIYRTYEKELHRTEGLSDYIERRARGLDPLNASEITNGIAPAGVRDLGYVEGRWIAMILDKLYPDWKSVIENNDSLFLEDMLAKPLAAMQTSAEGFSSLEIDSITVESRKTFSLWQLTKLEELSEYMAQPGYSLIVDACSAPFSIRIFEPLEIESAENGGVYHRLIFSAANQRSSIRIMNHPCITYFDNHYQLSAITIRGLKSDPQIDFNTKRCTVKNDGIDISLEFSEVTVTGGTTRIKLQAT